MKLKLNEVYKFLISEVEGEKDYDYFVCIAEKEEYYVLHEFEKYAKMNSLDLSADFMDDIDDYFEENIQLDPKHFKAFNSLEVIYYKTKVIEMPKPEKKRTFTIV